MTSVTVPVSTRAADLVAAEWIKVRSVRSTYLALLVASLLTPVLDMWFRPKAMI